MCGALARFAIRWDKGYRPFSPQTVVKRIQYLRDHYNVGFSACDEKLRFGCEKFGSLIEAVKP